MIVEPSDNSLSIFQAQFHYRAQAYFESHYYAKQSGNDFFQTFFKADVTMITKVDDQCFLSNPNFCIEECLNSL